MKVHLKDNIVGFGFFSTCHVAKPLVNHVGKSKIHFILSRCVDEDYYLPILSISALKRLTILPVGLVSKKDIGDLMTLCKSLS